MKLRIRSSATKETIRIEITDSSTLFDLKTLISSNLTSTESISPDSIHLSLNRSDEIKSSPEEHLNSLGLTSGDLLFYSLDSDHNSTPETLIPSPAPSVHMEVKSELEPFVQEKIVSLPRFFRRVIEMEKGKIKGNIGLTVMAIHAVFLDSGFIVFGGDGGYLLPEGFASGSRLVSVMYTLPDLLGLENVKNVILKFSAIGSHVSVYGCVVGGLRPDVYRLSFDSSMLDPLFASAVNELDVKEQEDVFQIWKTVKDRLSVPLLIDICLENGLDLPPCFTRLPTDLKSKILEFLRGIDLARVSCTCSELRYLASNDELWKSRFLEEFEMFDVGSIGGTWKDKFVGLWMKRKKYGMDRDNALASYIRAPRIVQVPWIPRAHRFPMIGGDYDRLPDIGFFGSSHRVGFNQDAARRDFSPNCNLGERRF